MTDGPYTETVALKLVSDSPRMAVQLHGSESERLHPAGADAGLPDGDAVAQGLTESIEIDLELVARLRLDALREDNMAIPKKCAYTSPGRRNCAYLK